MDYVKSDQKINADSKIIDARIDILNKNPDIITLIKNDLKIDYDASIYRPRADLGMLLFKETLKSPSQYTLNLLTLKPTANSPRKDIINLESYFS